MLIENREQLFCQVRIDLFFQFGQVKGQNFFDNAE